MVNVGSLDRAIRVVVGIALLILPFIPAASLASLGPWLWVAAAAGLVLIATGILGFCPAYMLVGLRTCPLAQPKK